MRHARKTSRIMLEGGWNKGIAGVTRADDVLRVARGGGRVRGRLG